MPFSRTFRQASALVSLSLLFVLPALAEDDPGQALRDAARAGQLAKVRSLLDAGTPVDSANRYGATALGYAADKGFLEVVQLLIERGADVDVEDTFYKATPLVWASYNEHSSVVRLLLENGAEGVEQVLDIAISKGSRELVEAVLAAEPPAEKLGRALEKARAADDAAEIVALLEAAGARVPDIEEVGIPAEILAGFAGSFLMAEGAMTADLTLQEGQLIAQFSGQGPLRLRAVEPRGFRPVNGPAFVLRMSEGDPRAPGFELVFDSGQTRSFTRRGEEAEEPAEATAEPVAVAAAVATSAEPSRAPELTDPIARAQRPGTWPAFRGTNASGVAVGTAPLPTTWPADEGNGLRWRRAIPGRAHSSPIVWGDRVYLTTAVSEEDDGSFRHGLYGDVDSAGNDAVHSWQLLALDRESGEILWTQQAHRGQPRADNHIKATQANATPATNGETIVAILGSEGLFAWNMDGKPLWKVDLGLLDSGWFYDPTYQWGHSSSPILFEDKVIVQVDRSSDSYVAAFALDDGRELWRTGRDNLPSWGTPTLLQAGERTELVTNGSHLIRAYDPRNGEELWSLGPNSELTVGTPVIGHGLVYLTGGYPPVRPIYAVRPGGRGDLTLEEDVDHSEYIAWSKGRGGTYMPTPLVYGSYLYTLANNGIFTCYDARTGEQLYRERLAARGGTAFTASPVAGDDKIFVASEDGDVYVLRAGPELEVLATNAMDEVIMATPAIAGSTLYIRSLGHLYAVEAPATEQTPSGESP